MTLVPDDYIVSTAPGHGRRAPARSWLRSDAPSLSLDGDWKFRLLPHAPSSGDTVSEFAGPDFDDSAWGLLPVPSHWVLEGRRDPEPGLYGDPIYTNVQLPIPLTAPSVPDANPTGEYRRVVGVSHELAGSRRVLLRFDGVESCYRVWVNGVEIGAGKGSRLQQEFDVTGVVRPGENTVAVRVHQWSAGTFAEDQDQWWLPGIFRSVTLLGRPERGIDDVWLKADYTGHVEGPGRGTIVPEVRAPREAFPLTLTVEALGIHEVWQSPEEVGPVEAPRVQPWSAEAPVLYEAVLSSGQETVLLRIGFRTVQIQEGVLRVNGRKVVFRGVNRHECDPDRGRVFDRAAAREDLLAMKRLNVNAIRTSHYPCHPELLDLADELGFWVILENDYETHAFEAVGWKGNPSDDPAWREALLDRMERTLERDKNHPCVIMWSLGNEAGTGENLAAMAQWVRFRDPSRPVHYEGDYQGRYTDVYSRMYATPQELAEIAAETSAPFFSCDAVETERQRRKPFLLCEYAHAMGNGPGLLDVYDELAETQERLHGGFIWEWKDHGLRRVSRCGAEYFAYGGDFGEAVHDGNFVMDGLVLSDGTPTPGAHEFAAVAAPVVVGLRTEAEGPVIRAALRNRRHTRDLSDLNLLWRVEEDGRLVDSGLLSCSRDLPRVLPGEETEIPLPDVQTTGHSEAWLTVEAVLAEDTPWASAGHLVSRAQTKLSSCGMETAQPRTSPRSTPVSPESRARLESALRKARLLLGGDPVLTAWRAPTDNDEGPGTRGVSCAQEWREARLHLMAGRRIAESVQHGALSRTTEYSAPSKSWRMLLQERWWLDEDGLFLRADVSMSGPLPPTLPRLGLRFDLSTGVDSVQWFGLGPGESYPDSRAAVFVARHESSVDGLSVDYARPQETGHRSEVRSLVLRSRGEDRVELAFWPDEAGRLPGFTLSRHTPEALAEAQHPYELSDSDHLCLILDAAQHGLGTAACGPGVEPAHSLAPEARSLTVSFRGLL